MKSRYISSLPFLLPHQWTVEGYIFTASDGSIPADFRRVGQLPDGSLLVASDTTETLAGLKPWPLRYQNDDGSPFAFIEATGEVAIYVELVSFRTRMDQSDDEPVWCVFRLGHTQGHEHLCDD